MTSPDSLDTLIARLRAYRWVTDFNPCPEAADALEALRAERDALNGMRDLYWELIYQVANKYPGESRHETAKRYIHQAEHQSNPLCQAMAEPKDGAATTEVKAFIEG
jgi:hypothetical protein